jgi:hypothetical protein
MNIASKGVQGGRDWNIATVGETIKQKNFNELQGKLILIYHQIVN